MKNFEEVIYQGAVFKNYKELCEALGEKVATGNQKKIQLESWRDLFDWENEGHKFIITDAKDNIHTALKQIEVKRSMIATLVQIAICELTLKKIKDQKEESGRVDIYSTELSMGEIAKTVGFINEIYSTYILGDKALLVEKMLEIYPRTQLIKQFSVEDVAKAISDACDRINHSYINRIEGALSRLEKKKIIYYCPVMYVVIADIKDEGKVEYEIKRNRYNQKTGIEVKSAYTLQPKRVATEEEIEFITSTKRRILKEMGYGDTPEKLIINGEVQEYNRAVNKALINSEYNIYNHYELYRIIPSEKYLEGEINSLYKSAKMISREFQNTLGFNKEKRLKKGYDRDKYESIKDVPLSESEEQELALYKMVLRVLIDKTVEKEWEEKENNT